MPPRASLTSSFSITDSNNEVVCPLRNQDGSSCRKRCIGEKRYRSMQEHIRRAHPEHYISKLPATEDSFMLMISTPPNERPPSQQNASPMSGSVSMGSGPLGVNINGPPAHGGVSPVSSLQHKPYLHDTGIMHREGPNGPNGFIGPNGSNGSNGPGGPSGSNGPNGPSTPSMRAPDEYGHNSILPAASAAAALAQLHNHKLERDWEEANPPIPDGWQSENDKARLQRSSVELPPIHMANPDVNSEPFPGINHNRPRELLPSILSTSPPGRSSTLPPLQRPLGSVRPRKQSITKRARESQHKKQKSRGLASDWLSKIQNESTVERLRASGQVKAMSAEPSDVGKRWEDLIDAAASATEDIDDDRTPVPQSPISIHRSSLPPFPHQTFQHHQHQQGYQASPLQQALTPPNYTQEAPEPFPSVESNESGEVFNMESRGLSDSSPAYSSQNPQIYCAACGNISLLKESYACTECICGLCQTCVEVLMSEQGARRKCPRCHTIGGRFKPFQLDIR